MPTTKTRTERVQGLIMDQQFYSLHDFMLHTKSVTYVLIGAGLVVLAGFWLFLSGRDEKIRKF